MDLVSLIGLISSVTGIISFVLYFVDKSNASKSSATPKKGGVSVQDWKLWAVVTALSICILIFASAQSITGIEGSSNDNNNIFIVPNN
jgi:hypothetical protein